MFNHPRRLNVAEIPNLKVQIQRITKFQYLKPGGMRPFGIDIGTSLEFGIWNLEFPEESRCAQLELHEGSCSGTPFR
ncbi:MAG: hypothetical protein DME84_00400 [Verrucomicrobia bacterium]|nr:MAG: hypothetical protein DME84_00400 [Verrucomicrobiota bacterium]